MECTIGSLGANTLTGGAGNHFNFLSAVVSNSWTYVTKEQIKHFQYNFLPVSAGNTSALGLICVFKNGALGLDPVIPPHVG